MKVALLIVDMQKGSFQGTPRFDADKLVQRLNGLAVRVRVAGGAVVYVQQNGPQGDPHQPDTEGWKLLAELMPVEGDHFVTKTSCDSFLGTKLSSLLSELDVRRLIITGCATDFCVDTTIRSALARGFDTVAPSDGHTTADRPYLNAEKIIEHHNAVWSNFISPSGAAQLVPCADIQP